MSDPIEAYHALRDAIQRRVCSVCLDRRDDGTCGLSGQGGCAIEKHLTALVPLLLSIDSNRMDSYVSVLESQICGDCEQDESGHCLKRERRECALHMYLPLVLEAIEEARGEPLAR